MAIEKTRMRKLIVLITASLILGGCDLLTAPTGAEKRETAGQAPAVQTADASAFTHSQTEDLSGFYYPAASVGEGSGRLILVFIGQTQDFAAWEKGERNGGFAPVMLEFEGGERVLPDSYSVSDNRVRFTGTSPSLGPINVDVRLDTGSLALARRNLGPDRDPALEGTVTAGGQVHSGVKFAWSQGGG